MTSPTTRSTAAVVATLALLAGCSGDDGGVADTTTTVTSTDTTTTVATTEAPTTPPATTEDAHESIRVEVGATAVPDGYRLSEPVDAVLATLGVSDFPRVDDDVADLIAASRAADPSGSDTTGLIYRIAVDGDHLDILQPFQAAFGALGSGNDEWTTDIVPGDDPEMQVLRVTSPLFGSSQGVLSYQVRALRIDEGEYRVTVVREDRPGTLPEMPAEVADRLAAPIVVAADLDLAIVGWDVFVFAEPSGDAVVEVVETVLAFESGGISADDVTAALDTTDVEVLDAPSPGISVVVRDDVTDWIIYDDGFGEAVVRVER